jgi:glycosyltransferase involved in cell wall biosynthesis
MNKDQFDILPKIVAKMTDGILYITQTGTSGYANAAKGYIYEILQKKISLTVSKVKFDTSTVVNTSKIDEMIDENMVQKPYNTVIVHTTPDVWDYIINTHNIPISKTIIGRTVWEFDKLIPTWVDAINNSRVDIVSVPSQWNKDAFINSGVTKPIFVEPHVYIDLPFDSITLESLIETGEIIYDGDFNQFDLNQAYKFYTIGQFIPRKGISETIELFCSSFTKNDKVILFLKTFGKDYSTNSVTECRNKIEQLIRTHSGPNGHAPIVFLKSELTDIQIKSLHQHCNCYVQLTRAEGFGLGIFEAYKVGNQVVTTKYGGPIDYLGSDYSGLVDYTLTPVKDPIFFQFNLDETYSWAKPSISHAQQLVKKLVCTTKIFVYGDLHDLESLGNGQYAKWFGGNFIIHTSNPINKLRIHYTNFNKHRKLQINDTAFTNLHYEGCVEVNLIPSTNVVKCSCPVYNPFKNGKLHDDRDLGIYVYSIEYTDDRGIDYTWYMDNMSTIKIEHARRFNVKNTGNNVYYHCGDFGDIIYALPVIKHTGGGILYLGNDYKMPERCLPRDMITWNKYQFMKSLLESQSYIKEVIFTDKYPENTTHDLNLFRKLFVNIRNEYDDFPNGSNISLLDAPLIAHGIDVSVKDKSWMSIQNNKVINKKIVINRTERVRNRFGESDDAYRYIVSTYNKDAVFVGTDTEYEQFIQTYGHVERYVVKNAEELAQLIDQCYVFIGNSSFAFALSESLKKESYFEIRDDHFKHTKFFRDGHYSLNTCSVSKIHIPKIYHVVSLYESNNPDTKQRMDVAKRSWDEVYRTNDNIIPVHVYEKDYPRTTDSIGDTRKCAFLKDIIKIAFEKCEHDDDIVMLTNDDTILSPFIGAKIYEKIVKYQSCKSFRLNVRQYDGIEKFDVYNIIGRDGGRDMFAFTRRWLRQNIGLIPDYALGSTDWDFYLAVLIQFTNGIWISQCKNNNDCVTDIEIGHVFHIVHDAPWRKLNVINDYNSQLSKNAIERLGFSDNFKEMNYDRFKNT